MYGSGYGYRFGVSNSSSSSSSNPSFIDSTLLVDEFEMRRKKENENENEKKKVTKKEEKQEQKELLRVDLPRDCFECSICFEEMKEVTTLLCGHSFCTNCGKSYNIAIFFCFV